MRRRDAIRSMLGSVLSALPLPAALAVIAPVTFFGHSVPDYQSYTTLGLNYVHGGRFFGMGQAPVTVCGPLWFDPTAPTES